MDVLLEDDLVDGERVFIDASSWNSDSQHILCGGNIVIGTYSGEVIEIAGEGGRGGGGGVRKEEGGREGGGKGVRCKRKEERGVRKGERGGGGGVRKEGRYREDGCGRENNNNNLTHKTIKL